MIIDQTNIHAFRIFDLGQQINLSLAKNILKEKDFSAFQVENIKIRSLLIVEHPLIVSLESFEETINDKTYTINSTARLWSFGTLSLNYTINVSSPHQLQDLNPIGNFLENSDEFHRHAKHQAEKLLAILSPSIEDPQIWNEYEDYLIFSVEKLAQPCQNLKQEFLNSSLASLILTEKAMKFSDETLNSFKNLMFQYGHDDLVLIHWNGALIYDPEDSIHIQETIEFALFMCQCLNYVLNMHGVQLYH